MDHKQKLSAIYVKINFFKPWSVSMLTVQFNFNLCNIVHKRANHHSNSVLKKLRKLIDLHREARENVRVINILHNWKHFLLFLNEKVSKVFYRKADSKAAKHF